MSGEEHSGSFILHLYPHLASKCTGLGTTASHVWVKKERLRDMRVTW